MVVCRDRWRHFLSQFFSSYSEISQHLVWRIVLLFITLKCALCLWGNLRLHPNHTCTPPLQFWCRWRRRHRSDAESSVLRSYSDNRSTWLRFLYHNIRWNVMIDGWAPLSARLLLHTLTPWDVSSGFFSVQCKELEKGVGGIILSVSTTHL